MNRPPNWDGILERDRASFIFAIVAAVAAGVSIARFSVLAFGGVVVITVGLLCIAMVRKNNLLAFALAACATLIAFPAFLPRTVADRESAAFGGGIDSRGAAQLAIIVAMIAMGLWLWLVSDAGVTTLFRPPIPTLLTYSFLILVSLLYAPDRAWSTFGLLKLLSIIVLIVVLMATVQTSDQLKRVIDTMLSAVAVLLAVYWIDIARGAASIYEGRPEVSWLNPNSATLAAVVLGIVMTARYLGTRPLPRPGLTIGLGMFGAVTALMAGSKSSLGAGATALVIVMAVVFFRSPTGFSLARLTIMLTGVVMTMAYFVVTESGVVAHLEAYESNQYVEPTTLTGRVPVWSTAITETVSSPFSAMVGHGYLSTFALGLQGRHWVAHQAHNSLVQTFFDLGLAGLIIVILLYAQTWFCVLRSVLTFPVGDQRWVRALELLAALTVLTVVSLTEDIMGGVVESRSFIFFIVVFGIHQNMTLQGRDGGQQSRAEPLSSTRMERSAEIVSQGGQPHAARQIR